jgi:uncharacterized protein YdeI (YjbR/CyaY-like superfamily)
MNPKVDAYLAEGCGRCPLGGTPDCKVHNWTDGLVELRRIVLDTEVTEELKWKVPCYTYNGNNILIIGAFKQKFILNFMDGVLMKDPHNLLVSAGENSRFARQLEFTDASRVIELEAVIKAYIAEAVEINKQGLKVELEDQELVYPDELLAKFDDDPAFRSAFEALTPGRQRGYILHFSSAKQSATRTRRIEKYMPQIFEGKGMQDR